ncbi:MAG TPA: hypothetical protein VLL95_08010, partial [Phnomibacter sp.]|nr:hypothetical protein [Phnomibacter sp.]
MVKYEIRGTKYEGQTPRHTYGSHFVYPPELRTKNHKQKTKNNKSKTYGNVQNRRNAQRNQVSRKAPD